jgi:hypothetical protein
LLSTRSKIGIGLAMPFFRRAMPGWGIDSYGYHGDDGNLFIGRPYGLDFTDPWEEGDVRTTNSHPWQIMHVLTSFIILCRL